MNLGIRVMVHMLRGNAETADAFVSAIGKTISRIEINDSYNNGDGGLEIGFTDGTGIVLFDDGRSCCERRWMHTDDDLSYFVGAKLRSAEISDGPTVMDEFGDPKESQFLTVTTSKGVFTVVNYDEHNGYYGGFALLCRALD